jgi:hypothetical protein
MKGSKMTRNLKALGLALVAVFALSAMTASAASATDLFRSSATPVTLTGEQEFTAGVGDLFSTTAGTVECLTAKYHGTVATSPTASVVVKPTYTSCFVAEIIPTKVDFGNCSYKFTIDEPAGATTGSVHLECGVGEEVTVTVGVNDSGVGTVKCTIHIPPQTVGGIKYTNVGASDPTKEITVDINSTGITYKETGGPGLGTGTGACTTSTLQHNGTYTGKALVTGEQDTGSAHIGIRVE